MDSHEALIALKKQMRDAADKLEFEKAAVLRDEILKIENGVGKGFRKTASENIAEIKTVKTKR